jgi:hypothetical protein
VKIFQDGLIEVTPALSKILSEPTNDLPPDLASEYHKTLNPASISAIQPLSAFLSEHTAESGLRKGFRVSTFKFRSHSGADFEYVLYNQRDVLIPHQIEELLLKDELIDSIRSAEVRSIFRKNDWKQDPSSLDYIYCLQCEIVSASNYLDVDKLFVTYQLYYPPAWNLRTGNLTDADINDGKNPHSISYNDMDNYGMTAGITHTATYNTRFFSYSTLSSSQNGKTRYLRTSRRNSFPFFTRCVFAIFFFLSAILSVVEGINYPIWIFPIFVIVFVGAFRGSSSNNPSVILIPSTEDNKQANLQQARRQNKRITNDLFHLENTTNNLKTEFLLNHLLNYNFDAKDVQFYEKNPLDKKNNQSHQLFSPSVTQQYPVLFLQVYSKDSFGHSTLLGYADCILPLESDEFVKEVSSWKPVGSVRNQLHEFFIGDNIHLKDATFTRDFDNITKSLNRFGLLTQSTGNLKIRGKVIKTDIREIEKKRKMEAERELLNESKGGEGSQKLMNNYKMKKSITDIMKNFKDAKKLGLSTIAEGKNEGDKNKNAAGAKGIEKPSIKNILESINSTAKNTKATELLNRLRNKKQEETAESKQKDSKWPDKKKLELPQSRFPPKSQPQSSKSHVSDRKGDDQQPLLEGNEEQEADVVLSAQVQQNRNNARPNRYNKKGDETPLESGNANEQDPDDEDAPLLKR